MGKPGMNLQDSFLNQVRKDNTEIMVIMLDGTRLIGYVRGFDNFTVIMSARGQQHLIYKHAISQIVSRRPAHEEVVEHAEGAPAQEHAAPQEEGTGEQAHPPREERPRRDESRRRDDARRRDESQRKDESQPKEEPQRKDKFNTIDLSNLKVKTEDSG